MKTGGQTMTLVSVLCLASALLWAGECYQDSTNTCCNAIINGPDSEPCGATTCVDIIITNSTINWVVAAPSGYKTTIVQEAQQTCKWENRVCVGGVCRQGPTETILCTSSRIVAPLTSCP
ncbi:MAG: hypothetical protein HBSAPP03_24090 [Phycisphaerae bacterium]|nr:MAG: hypothetical protein HBSAPP03_24090 [Phycisphaerae bacterium]